MHITISVGWSQEISSPDSGRLEATCNVSFAVDHHLFEADLESVLQYVNNALVVCRQAVEGELASQTRSGPDDDAGNSAVKQTVPEALRASHSGSNGSGSRRYNGDGFSGTVPTQL